MKAFLCIMFAAATALGQYAGTYTIKQDSTGDFLSFSEVCDSLYEYGVAGECWFEAYSGRYEYGEGTIRLGTDDPVEYPVTFRAAEGETVVLFDGGVYVYPYWGESLSLEDLIFDWCYIIDVYFLPALRVENCVIRGEHRADHGVRATEVQNCSIIGNDIYVRGRTFEITNDDPGIVTVCNNLICSTFDEPREAAMYFEGVDTLILHHNTVFDPNKDTYGSVYVLNTRYAEMSNNVISMDSSIRRHPACLVLDSISALGLSSDYNAFFVGCSGYVAEVWGDRVAARYDLPGWQAAGHDSNSIHAKPDFRNPDDLHLSGNSPCIGAGVPVPGITHDIDGDPRDPVHPDIGGDEYTPGAIEAEHARPLLEPGAASSIVRDILFLPGSSSLRPHPSSLLDASGRRVMDLLPGANAVGHLAPGVYFVTPERGRAAKVVVQR